MRWIALPLVVLVFFASCGQDPEAQAAARAAAATAREDSLMAAATEALQEAVFDTVTWENEEAALERGSVVYSYSCSGCHGRTGLGDAGKVLGTDTLRPPSFKEPGWRFAGNVEGLREYIFLGNREGMHHWGIAETADGNTMKEKDIDAVARYLAAGMD